MVLLLNSQGMKNCKSTESFCLIILAIYTNDWSNFDMLTAAMFLFFWKIPKYVQAQNNILSPLIAWPTWIGILWKWASMPTKLAGDGECRLARFHVIRNVLANAIYQFSRLPHQTGCLLPGQLGPYNQLLILPLWTMRLP